MTQDNKQTNELRITIRIPEPVIDQFRHMAEEDNRSLNSEIVWMMKTLISLRNGETPKRELTLEEVAGSVKPLNPGLSLKDQIKIAREDRADRLLHKLENA